MRGWLVALAVTVGGLGWAWHALTQSVDGLVFAANAPDAFGAHAPIASDVAYGADPAQRLDVYAPVAAGRDRPGVVFVHGGRWSSGDKQQYRFVALTLTRAGAVAVLPNYRLYPRVRMAAAMQDFAASVAYVQAHAREWGADPSRVIVMGFSAGAQLAALGALDTRWLAAAGAAPVQGLIGLAGPYDFLPLTDDDLRDYFGPAPAYPLSQPINFVAASSPRAFLVQGLADDSVRPFNTEHLARALVAAGVPVETHYVPGAGHYWVLKHFVGLWRGRDAIVGRLAQFIRDTPPAALLAPAPPPRSKP